MQNRIQKLSPLLINQIAAGEVVTRPASVVKELLENAIDAGATHITVHIEQGGLGLIQVADNGRGIHKDDMILAVTRHATSKLADVGELVGIQSLGFRGEALASIAAVSHLTLASSGDDAGIGQQVSLSGSDTSHLASADIRPIVKNQGTTVSVRDLYFNVPARRANLKSIATEFAQIEQVVQRIAISFADIEMQLFHQNKLRLNLKPANLVENNNSLSKKNLTSPSKSSHLTLSRLENALNLSLQHFAIPFELSLTALQLSQIGENEKPANVYGWLFLTQNALNNLQYPKLIYINQRLVTDFAISQTIAKSARQVGINGSQTEAILGYALFFELPVDWINVNIHPSKQQVKIQPLTNIMALLNQALQDTLKQYLAETPLQNHKSLRSEVEADGNALTENAFFHAISPNNSKQIIQDFSKQNSNLTKAVLPKFSKTPPKNFPNQVNEFHADYMVEASENTDFPPHQLFDNSPKFLKVVEQNGQQLGLIFWQDVFYWVKLDLLTETVLADKAQFVDLLHNFEGLSVEHLTLLLRSNDES